MKFTFNIIAIVISFLILLMTIFSCEKKKVETKAERKERVENKVAQRLESQRIKKMKACRNNATIIAEKKVDSILIAEAKLLPKDTVPKPDIPIRPDAPIVPAPKDNTPVKPLFDKGSELIEQ